MEPGCFQDELYRWEEAMQKRILQLERRITAQDACIRLQDRDIADMRKRIVALESLGGATPTKVVLATADPAHKLGFAVDTEMDMEPIRGRIHDVTQWEDTE